MSTATLTAWDVVLFPAPRPAVDPTAPRHLSPRAAFQVLLHERAVLIDLRDADERAVQGEVAANLEPQYLTGTELGSWLAAHHGDVTEVILLSQRGIRAGAALAFLRRRHPDITIADIAGGFEAWTSTGMPVAR